MTAKEVIRNAVHEFYITRGYMPVQIEVPKDLFEAYENEMTPVPMAGSVAFTGIPVVWRERDARVRN